jgi:NADH-quinone oxidoreductase subunit M
MDQIYRILLLVLLGLPALAVVVVAFLGPRRSSLVRQFCLAVTVVDAVIACVLAFGFLEAREAAPMKATATTFRPEFVPGSTAASPHTTEWDLLDLGKGKVKFFIGLDGLNIWLVVLTTLLMVAAVLVSWTSIEDRVNEYHAWLLALGVGMLGVFLAFDILLFYVFF